MQEILGQEEILYGARNRLEHFGTATAEGLTGPVELPTRYPTVPTPPESIHARVILASVEVVEGFRTKEGEAVLQSPESDHESDSGAGWILGVTWVIEISGGFHWTNQKALPSKERVATHDLEGVCCVAQNAI